MEKRKFLFASLTGLISDIAWQVSKEGHEVRYYIKDQKESDIADGFVAKSDDWEKDADWADIAVFDDTLGQGEKARHCVPKERNLSEGRLILTAWKMTARSARRN
jgi:hypothetical protein